MVIFMIIAVVLVIVYVATKNDLLSSLVASVLSVWSFYPLARHLIFPEENMKNGLIVSVVLCTLAYSFFFQNLLDIIDEGPSYNFYDLGDGYILREQVDSGVVFLIIGYAVLGALLYWISTKWLPLIYIASIVSILASNWKCIHVILNAD